MKDFLLKLVPVWRLKPLALLSWFTGQKLVLPFYHAVEDVPKAFLKHAYPARSTKAFEKDLDELLKHFDPIGADELLDLVQKDIKPGKRKFHLSFDDGLHSFYTHAVPVLKRKGIPASVFINSSFVDNKDLFYRYKASLIMDKALSGLLSSEQRNGMAQCLKCKPDLDVIIQAIDAIEYADRHKLNEPGQIADIDFKAFLKSEKPYLTTAQIKELIKDGFTFGAHSLDHPGYKDISLKEQLRQTTESVRFIKEKFEVKNAMFSFPFTDDGVSSAFFDQLNHEKHKPLLSFGTAGMKKDSVFNNLQRIPIEKGQYSAVDIIKTEYVYYFFKALTGKNTLKRN